MYQENIFKKNILKIQGCINFYTFARVTKNIKVTRCTLYLHIKPNRMNKRIIVVVVLILMGVNIHAHNVIKGRVVDAKERHSLVGANITIKGTSCGTITDVFGNFVLRSEDPVVAIELSFIGYKTEEVIIGDHTEDILVELEPESIKLEQVSIRSSTVDNLSTLSKVDVNLRPAKSSQEILRIVPGLFISQHAGGGKAEQLFLRGFDIDHGTDIAINVDGIPVNMVSQAHGHGYADLHFLIPELINNVDFGKGPYYTDHGNFNTAGYVDFSTLNRLDKSRVQLEVGQYNTKRALAMIDLFGESTRGQKQNAYLASEYMLTDGPFESKQHFNRINLFGKYTNYIDNNKFFTLQFSHFKSKWDASGQIPLRAVEKGIINHLGAIDSTEGGFTGRTNISARMVHVLDNKSSIENQIYYSKYHFDLYSNFTFFLEDPVNGDQIRQREERDIFGYHTKINFWRDISDVSLNTTIGGGFRYDNIDDIELSHTLHRKHTLNQIAFGDIDETNVYIYMNEDIEAGKFFINLGVRLDYFNFEYVNKLLTEYGTSAKNKTAISPKLSLMYNHNRNVQFYLKSGIGFHSNDSRVVLDQSVNDILPRAYGSDLGTILKPWDKLFINAALWYLFLEDEYVYVGDAGVLESAGETRRYGVDLSLRYQLTDWLFADADVNYANPRIADLPEGENHIPLAPILTSTGGLSFQHKSGLNACIRYRYMDDRPANEDNSVVAQGYTVVDLVMNYTKPKYEVGLSIENLLNTEWRETQFDTESRLFYEEFPVSEIHYTPGTPFFLKVKMAYFF